jgi:hypothetical protein
MTNAQGPNTKQEKTMIENTPPVRLAEAGVEP